MANDFLLNDPKLRDPVRQIPDGLKDPIQDKTPGFFQSLRNPLDLMLEESLPASLYQFVTGNTKKKQAQEALDFIRNNPDLAGELYGGEVINRFAVIHLIIGMTLPFISTLLVLMYDIDRGKHNTHISDLGYVEEK